MKISLALLLVLTSLNAQAALKGVPFMPEADSRFDALEKGTGFAAGAISTADIATGAVTESKLEAPTGSGAYAFRMIHAVWDPSGVSAQRSVGAHSLGVTMPAHSIITHSFFYTKTSVVSTNNDGTIAFSCTSANDILSAADIDSSSGVAGQIGAGVSVGTAATMKIGDGCTVTATVAVDAFTAGKIDLYLEYVVTE